MGTYLSTPVTAKGVECGESLNCPDVPCEWSVVDMQGWRKAMEDSHVAATNVELPQRTDSEDGNGSSSPPVTASNAKVFGVFDGHGGPEVARMCGLYTLSVLTQQDAWVAGGLDTMPSGLKQLDGVEAAETSVGRALRSTFHALDRIIGDSARRDEVVKLRSCKPKPGERRVAKNIPKPKKVKGKRPTCIQDVVVTSFDEDTSSASTEAEVSTSSEDHPSGKKKELGANGLVGPAAADEAREETTDGEKQIGSNVESAPSKNAKSGKGGGMLKRMLSLGSQSSGDSSDKPGKEKENPPNVVKAKPTPVTREQLAQLPARKSATQPSVIQNGRMVCNLPDHPIHAGATAIVAVITGKILTVANAGDSRAVLCRDGKAVPLSFDHKPQQERERIRIANAGGFVNLVGRVNGNLNLSRSIGDLKYKQVPGVKPSEQIITAEPDIIQMALEPQDEFFILGCDGIWDCLSSEGAIEYVRSRIATKTLTEICTEMLDEIISENPRATQGIGGDNMTVMIVDLQPKSRNRPVAPPGKSPPAKSSRFSSTSPSKLSSKSSKTAGKGVVAPTPQSSLKASSKVSGQISVKAE